MSLFTKNPLRTFFLILTLCSTSSAAPVSSESTVQPLASVQWCGTDHLLADPEGASIRQVADLKETRTLVEQTIQKLSIAPWVLLGISPDVEASAPLRSLLQEAVRRPCVLEWMVLESGSLGIGIAVRSEQLKLETWNTNLVATAKSLLGNDTRKSLLHTNGWIISRAPTSEAINPTSVNTLSLLCTNNWILLTFASNTNSTSLVHQQLLAGITSWNPSNTWLKSTVHFDRLAARTRFPTNLLASYPKVNLTANGQNGKVHTELHVSFRQPLNLTLNPWQVPTNLIEKPTASFSAIRGLQRLLAHSLARNEVARFPTPDQFFVWALDGQPRLTFFGANVTNATELMERVVKLAIPTGDSWMNAEGIAGFKKSDDGGLEWQGMPYVWPFLRPVVTNELSQILGGTFVYVPVMEPLSPSFFEAALKPDDLMYYGWERTGTRLEHWLFIGQFVRFVSGKAQMPFECPSIVWLKALQDKLGETTTRILLKSPRELQLLRSSSIGLTAIELHLLADWLESPSFPEGMHTLLATPEPRP